MIVDYFTGLEGAAISVAGASSTPRRGIPALRPHAPLTVRTRG